MLSIIIPIYNALDYAELCVNSIIENTSGQYEIIIVDNNSTPPVPEGNYRLIRNEENLGYPKAINQGVKEATGEYHCLMNSDVVVTPFWNELLIASLSVLENINPDLILSIISKSVSSEQI